MKIQLAVPSENAKPIDRMMKEHHIHDYKELFNTALTVLSWCFKEVDNGRVIASLDEKTGKYKELSMPAFGCRRAA
jgi:hypothetical protein